MISAFLTVGFPMLIRQNYTFGIVSRIFLGSLHSGWFPGSISHSNQGLIKINPLSVRRLFKSLKALQGAWGAWAPEEEKCQLIMTGFVGAISGATGWGQ